MYYDKFEMLCEKKGVKPGQVSRETGVSTATLTSWKQGKYTPKPDKLKRIADYFDVPLSYITGEEEEEEKGYYINSDVLKTAQLIFENKDLRLLFDSAVDNSSENIQLAAEMLRRFKETNIEG